jgi:hypothetical protein
MPKIAGHDLTDRQMVALHAIYKGVLRGRKVYGVNVGWQLDTLANQGIISRTGMGDFMIPFGSPGADIVGASLDFVISQHLG